MNFSRFINQFSALRLASPLRKLTEIQTQGGDKLISFGTGAPNASCFPFDSISFQTKDGHTFDLAGNALNKALQYGPTSGMPELVTWLKTLQQKIHNPPTALLDSANSSKMDLLITPGSQDGLSKIFEMILHPGDYFLLEEPSYPGTLAALRPYNLNYLKIQCDSEGMRPDSLRNCLSKWTPEDSRDLSSPIPKLLYLQPNYSNPTGASIPAQRRQEIFQIAKDYDLLIIEDDPYYFLGFESTSLPSFLSMDTDGRVLRLDSFSKIMSSGVAGFYKDQCSHLLAAADEHLHELAEWSAPSGGMFLWMKIKGVDDTNRMIMERGLEKQVVFAPGNMFLADFSVASPYVRASFSNVTPANMKEGFRRLAELIRTEQSAYK